MLGWLTLISSVPVSITFVKLFLRAWLIRDRPWP